MSINTTSTSDRIATGAPTTSSAQESLQPEDAQRHERASVPMAAVPDPAVIARLANEFFAALPEAASVESAQSSASPDRTHRHATPTPILGESPRAAVPDYPRETFSFPALPNQRSVPGGPQLPSSPPTGALSETDFRRIAASLASVLPLVPQASSTAPPTTVPSSVLSHSSSAEGEQAGPRSAPPWAAAPQLPPSTEMYSFPAVPAMSSPPTAPPSGTDLAAVPSTTKTGNTGRTDPWAAVPHFAGLSDVYSFPRVPGASVPGVPEVYAPQPSIPASPPLPGSVPASPYSASVANVPDSMPDIPEPAPFAIPAATENSGGLEKALYPGITSKFPSVGEMFSFPGVPGAQSPPGILVLPSSIATHSPSETDLRTLPSTPAGSSATAPQIPEILKPAIPGLSGIPETKRAPESHSAQSGSLPAGVESFEFRPDLAPAELGAAKRPFDPKLIRQDFPILQERVNGRPLIWLDNAATTQKPNAVIDRLPFFYQHENSNIHRPAHTLAARATDAYESAREKTRRFLNASSTREIIFVRGTTEAINLVAKSWGHRHVQKDDEIVITWLEHHANIVPWQQLCSEKGARLRVAPVNDRGEVILEEYEKLLSPRTRIVSFSQVSNALGTITPAREMVEMAHRHGALVLVDGAQAVSHMRIDVQALDCDFYVFSGHKVFAPTGIGVVYGKLDVLDTMPPWQGGGNMIADVTFEKTAYQPSPPRFEAGTGNIADAVGLGAAIDYVSEIGMENIAAYEHDLLNYGTARLLTVPGLRLIGTAREKAGVMSFVLDDVRTEDVGVALTQEGIAVRSGHHCAQPILRRMGVENTVRPSLALYNTYEDIDALVAALLRLQAGRGRR